jgi:hypothetical protein
METDHYSLLIRECYHLATQPLLVTSYELLVTSSLLIRALVTKLPAVIRMKESWGPKCAENIDEMVGDLLGPLCFQRPQRYHLRMMILIILLREPAKIIDTSCGSQRK